MRKLWNQRGETLVESLISMVIIAMTGMMLAMAAATVLRSNTQAGQTMTFLDTDAAVTSSSDYTVSLGGVSLGTVTVKEQGGLYSYDAKD